MGETKLELTLTRGEQKLAIASWSAYRLLSVSGLESTEYKLLFEERAMSDGDDYRGARVGRRGVEIEMEVLPARMDEERRLALIHFFEPGGEGVLTVDRGLGRRMIDFRLGRTRFWQESAAAPLRVTISLICPEPWFYGEERRLSMCDKHPILSFPFLSYYGGGLTAGYREPIRFLYLDNDGDLPIGVTAQMRVLSGTAKQPYLYCGGERVTVNGTLAVGDFFSVSTEEGKKGVLVNGEDAAFTSTSSFFQVGTGRNLIIASCRGGGEIGGEIVYRFRYFGA